MSDTYYPPKDVPRVSPPALAPGARKTCNRHDDCAAADARHAAADGPRDYYGRRLWSRADHCHDDDCEDCFGK